MFHSHSCGVSSATERPWIVTPALLQATCSSPNALTAASPASRTEARSDTSVTTAIAFAPSPRTSASAASSRSPRMSHSTTAMPSRANVRAIPRPMPEAAPVTIAVLPSSCCIVPLVFSPSWTVAALWSTVLAQRSNAFRAKTLRGGHGQGAKSAGSRGRRGLRDDRRGGTLFRPGPRVRLVGAHGAGLFPDHPELSHHRHRPRARASRALATDGPPIERIHVPPAVRDPRRHPGVRLPDRPHRPRAHRRGARPSARPMRGAT